MTLEEIKKLTLRALMNDENLMYGLVLKGGNALQLVYDITDRASMDIDFSIENDFTELEFERISGQLQALLGEEFIKRDHFVFDIKFVEKPKSNGVKEWKGYNIEFKITHKDKWYDDIDKTRRNAIKIVDQSTKFSVDISSYEYVQLSKKHDLDGTILRVYTPEMIVVEKLRALCQSIPEYSDIIPSARIKGRARDFYDIWNICNQYQIDLSTDESLDLIAEVFKAKRVPINFLELIPNYKDLQKQNWESVVDTLGVENEGFDYYYDFVIKLITTFRSL